MICDAIRVTFPPRSRRARPKALRDRSTKKYKPYRNRIRASLLAYKAAQKQSSNYFCTGVELECYHEINQGTNLRTLCLVERILPAIAHHLPEKKCFTQPGGCRTAPGPGLSPADHAQYYNTIVSYCQWFIAS